MDNQKMNKHEWKYTGCHPHNGEYWYECTVCGLSDWIGSYKVDPSPLGSSIECKPKEEPIIYNI